MLPDADAGARGGLAGEAGFLDLVEENGTANRGMDGEILAHISARTSDFGRAGLAHQYFAGVDFLATKTLDAKAGASIVMDIFTGSTSFYMCHYVFSLSSRKLNLFNCTVKGMTGQGV